MTERTSAGPQGKRLLSRLLGARLGRDSRGSTSAMVAAAFVPVIISIGGAVDLGRAYVIKSQLQTAVDSAALAAAQSCKTKVVGGQTVADTSDAVPQADAYFDNNFGIGYMGATGRTLTKTEMCTGTNFMRVALNVEATMPYSFARIAGFTSTTISAAAVAETSASPATIEAVMVLDVTGSMTSALGSSTRIQALRDAAKDFVDVLYQADENKNKASLAIGVVPYNITVNLGAFGTSRVGTTVEAMTGFTDAATPANVRWAGCVRSDPTITNMSNDINVQDAGAWDIRSDIRGFNGSTAPQLRPFLYYPSWIKKNIAATAANKADPANTYYQEAALTTGPSFQDGRYKFSATAATNDTLASSQAYRLFYWDAYSGLNSGSGNASNDVIVRSDTGGYYDPTAAGNGRTAANWKVNTARIPRWSSTYVDGGTTISDYPVAGAYGVTNLTAKSPNQQCPAAINPIAYGKTMSSHKNWIDTNIVAMKPGAGTIHHAGMIWGYRMLQNTFAFPRTNTTTKAPKRVILFMTDGNYEFADWSTNATERSQWGEGMYSLYDRIMDKRLTTSSDPEVVQTQSSLRFSKVCQAAKNEGASVYVVALAISDTTSDNMFSACAPGDKYKKAATAAQLREAFQAIAREIVDLHLVS
jgi:Flp pilus assembly protein TadG